MKRAIVVSLENNAVEIAGTRLRQAAGRYGATLLESRPVRQEMQALDELMKSAIAYDEAVRAPLFQALNETVLAYRAYNKAGGGGFRDLHRKLGKLEALWKQRR